MVKFKRIMSILVTAAMLSAVFPVMGVHAENIATITQNGAVLDGMQGLPLSFTATVTFPVPVDEGTALDGITVTAGEVAVTPEITQGTLTTDSGTGISSFTTATVKMPVLENGLDYKISVPAIGENAAVEAVFTTVGNPYFVKEEFNGGFVSDMYTSSGMTTRSEISALKDTDSDGVTDAIYYNGYHSGTFDAPTDIPLTSAGEVMFETRVKFDAKNDSYRNSDGTIMVATNNNDRGLIRFYATSINNHARIGTSAAGELTYGENHGEFYNTGYKLYENKWYTMRIALSSNRRQMKVVVTDDEGNCFDGEWVNTSYGGTDISKLNRIVFPYASYVHTYIDYIHVWDNLHEDLGDVTVTYGAGAALSGATGVPVDGVIALVDFGEAISEADLEKIKISGNVAEKSISNDGTSVKLALSGLSYDTKYIIDIPSLSGNQCKTVTFQTVTPPEPTVKFGDSMGLSGATDVPVEFEGTLLLSQPISADTDFSGISISGGSVLAEYKDENTVSLTVSGLSKREYYTLTIPALGTNPATEVSFRTADEDWYVWRAEFDGKDTEIPLKSNSTNDTNFGSVADGLLVIPKAVTAYTTSLQLEEPIDVSGSEKYTFETRIRFHQKNAREDGLIHAGKKLLMVLGKEGYNSQMSISSTQGKLGYGQGGDNASKLLTDFDLKDNTWYTVKTVFSPTDTYYDLYVTSEDGEAIVIENAVGSSYPVTEIHSIVFSYRYDVYADVDYIRIIDESLLPKAAAKYGVYGENLDGAGKVGDGETVTLTFPVALEEGKEDIIKLDGNVIEAELDPDGTTAVVTLPDMTPRTFHTLTVDATDKISASTFKFRAADEAKYLYRAEFDGYDDDSVWYTIVNSSLADVSNSSSNISDGVYTETFSTQSYAAFRPTFIERSEDSEVYSGKTPLQSHALDCEGMENVTIETKVMVGEGTLDSQFLYLGYNMIMLGIGENNELRYNADAGSGRGTPFMVNDKEFIIEPGVWYTITMNLDFVAHKYNVSVDNGMGDIANSGALNFIYNATRTKIYNLRYSRMLNKNYAPMSIDYLRIINEDYGKAEVTYNDGYPLDGASLLGISDNVFKITADNEVASAEGIVIQSEEGEEISIEAAVSGNVITVTQTENFNFNTKYTLKIPAEITGAEADQTVGFVTEWDKTKEFVYPEGFSEDDELNVIFFGGSITNQNGWRKYTTEWFEEKFPNVNCINSAIGGTGSLYGWQRLKRDVISKDPDVVFIEFAVNDSRYTETTKYMESIVRNLNKLEKKPVIMFVYTANIDFSTNIYTISEHERLASAYGIPTINIHDYARTLYNTDSQFAADWDNKVYLGDGTHPTETGDKLYGDYVTALLTADSSKYFVTPEENNAVEALTSYEDYTYEFKDIGKTLTAEDNSYTAEFVGSEFILQYPRSLNGGKLEVVIDGDEDNKLTIDTYGESRPYNNRLELMELEDKKHTIKITMLTDDVNENVEAGTQTVKLVCFYWKATANEEFGIPGFDRDAVAEGTPLVAKSTVVTSSKKNVTIAIALYDGEGRFVGIKTEEWTVPAGVETEVSVSVTPVSGTVKAKAFLWDSVFGMVPLADIDEI